MASAGAVRAGPAAQITANTQVLALEYKAPNALSTPQIDSSIFLKIQAYIFLGHSSFCKNLGDF